ncbi:MAG: deoxycytidylate deaminase [Candidatus Avelusimicrobium sp.]|uniref:deoxycytidylate deaminase n=1 Tax=Candidatus Avelusimicrobium sp. TaxID=3048833 RepID=UPI002A5B7C8A|nr:deaminase [Elusimicrobiota bacterium]
MKNKHRLFIKMAELVAEQSTCLRLQVGAVLVKDNRVISIGFNGTPTGQLHCEENFRHVYEKKYKDQFPTYEEFLASREFYDLHGKWSIENELHAEQNAISFAAKNGIATQGADVYVTWSPCVHCAKVIVSAGIKKVFYKNTYDRSPEGIFFLEKNGIECRQLTEEDIARVC